jgi:hypothetical protein
VKRQLHCRGEKGREQTGRGQADFQKAVAAYPGYAAAWNELGRVQATLGQSDNARTSFPGHERMPAYHTGSIVGLLWMSSALSAAWPLSLDHGELSEPGQTDLTLM